MMVWRWRFAFFLGSVMFVFVYVFRLERFYVHWYGTPVTIAKIIAANLAYVRGDWLTLLPGIVIIIGFALNWALEVKRAGHPR